MIFIDYQFLQEADLVCKVSTFFRIIHAHLAHYFKCFFITLLPDVDFGERHGEKSLFAGFLRIVVFGWQLGGEFGRFL